MSIKKPAKPEKFYNASSIKAAVLEVSNGSTVYKAAKKFSIPWSTLKAYCSRYQHDPFSSSQLKRGKPFVLPSEVEIELLNYINKMQEIGFGLTVKQIRIVAYRLAEKAQIKHPFSRTKQYAGWYWWASFKKRYNLSLRTPESLSMNRAHSATRESINEFYKMLEELYSKLGIQNQPQRIWNLDETGFMLS